MYKQKIKTLNGLFYLALLLSCNVKQRKPTQILPDEKLNVIPFTVLDTLILQHRQLPDTLIVGYLDNTSSMIIHKSNHFTNYYYKALNCFFCSKSGLGTYKGAKINENIVGFAQSIEQVEDTVYVNFESNPIITEIIQYRSEIFNDRSGKQKYQLIPKNKYLLLDEFIYSADLNVLSLGFKINKLAFKAYD